MTHTQKSIDYKADKQTDYDGDVDYMVTDWRVKDGLQLQKKTLNEGWVDADFDEAPSTVKNSIEAQKVTDELYKVEYKNVDKNDIEDAFVIPFKNPLDDCIVKPVFEKDSTSYAENIEEQSGKSLDELIKSKLVSDGENIYESKGYFYFVKRLFTNMDRLTVILGSMIPMIMISPVSFMYLREPSYSKDFHTEGVYSKGNYILDMTFGEILIIMCIFFITVFFSMNIILMYSEIDYITFDKLF